MEIIRTTSEKARLRARRRLLRNTINFMVICSFLAVLNYMTSPGVWWVQWVVAGWGLHLVLQIVWHITDCDDADDDR